MHTYGVYRILSALPNNQLRHFHLTFGAEEELNGLNELLDPTTGTNAPTCLARFKNLGNLTLSRCNQAMFSSWKPSMVTSRYLDVEFVRRNTRSRGMFSLSINRA